MPIALSPARKLQNARYTLYGQLSQNANWVQSLELPADGNTVSISGQTVSITFRENPDDTSAALTVSPSVTDADTISISATATTMSALDQERYYVDLKSTLAGVVTHWAHGVVTVNTDPTS